MNDPPKRDVMLFAEALQLSPAERCAFLERACGADAELRQRVEQLLKVHDQAGDFLEQPPPEAESMAEAPIGEKPGDRIGPIQTVATNWRSRLRRGLYGRTGGPGSPTSCPQNY